MTIIDSYLKNYDLSEKNVMEIFGGFFGFFSMIKQELEEGDNEDYF